MANITQKQPKNRPDAG